MIRALCLVALTLSLAMPSNADTPAKPHGDQTPPSFPAPPNLPPVLGAPLGNVEQTDTCGARPLQPLVGQAMPDPFPATGRLRVYRTGDPVTRDFRPDRVNVELHPETGLIVAISCG